MIYDFVSLFNSLSLRLLHEVPDWRQSFSWLYFQLLPHFFFLFILMNLFVENLLSEFNQKKLSELIFSRWQFMKARKKTVDFSADRIKAEKLQHPNSLGKMLREKYFLREKWEKREKKIEKTRKENWENFSVERSGNFWGFV